MKVAVTGGSGLIGRMFIETYSSKYKCIVLGRSQTIDISNRLTSSFEYRQTDYTIESLQTALNGVDSVVHLAAKKVTNKVDNFTDYIQANLFVTYNVFEACRLLKIKNVIFASSRMVYSKDNKLPWFENDDPKPVDFYGITKLSSEKLAHHYNKCHHMNIKSLRFTQVIDNLIEPDKTLIVSEYIWSAIHEKALTVYRSQGRRDYIYVKDVVAAINCALLSRDIHGVFNIGSGTNISSYELAILVNKVFNNEGNIKIIDRAEIDQLVVLLNIEKARDNLCFTPEWPLESTLIDLKKNRHSVGYNEL